MNLASSGSATPALESVRPGEVSTVPRKFSTGAVLAMTGVSARQLQWWDEQGLAIANHIGVRRREYTFEQALRVLIVADLRQKGTSLARIWLVTTGIVSDSRVRDAVDQDSELFLLVGKKNSRIALSESMAVRDMVLQGEAFQVIALHEIISTLKRCSDPRAVKKEYS